jgi:hypothetical protein
VEKVYEKCAVSPTVSGLSFSPYVTKDQKFLRPTGSSGDCVEKLEVEQTSHGASDASPQLGTDVQDLRSYPGFLTSREGSANIISAEMQV